jgi:formiminotetrahydrofolate cyclodeaminase
VPGLAAQTLASFLDEVAAPTPAPGGGSSAGCTAALAAALVEMAALLARGGRGEQEPAPEAAQGAQAHEAAQRAPAPDAAQRAAVLRHQALELAERELSSYEPVLDALRGPADDPARPQRLERALLEASRAPLAIAQAAAELAELGLAVARSSSPSVRGDALTGTLLAEAAAAAAATLVEINLAQLPSSPLRDQARQARARAARARDAAEAIG